MCLIRRSALVAAGNWSSDTICEDTDLGLTILELGWTAHYTNRRYGHGLLPDSYQAYKRQRDRWAYGGFQIMKKHWRRFLPGASQLTREQKREFAARLAVVARRRERRRAGRAAQPDLGAVRRRRRHRHPDKVLTIPILAAFVVAVAAFRVALPAARAASRRPDAGCGVCRHGVAMDRRARGRHRPDQGRVAVRAHRQGRRPDGATAADFPAFWEAVLGALLIASAIYPLRHQLGAGARDRPVRACAGGAVAAVPGLGRARRAGRHARQRFRVLAQASKARLRGRLLARRPARPSPPR